MIHKHQGGSVFVRKESATSPIIEIYCELLMAVA